MVEVSDFNHRGGSSGTSRRQPAARVNVERGLQLDSSEALVAAELAVSVRNVVVARDGIEPPTPAFSGLRSTN